MHFLEIHRPTDIFHFELGVGSGDRQLLHRYRRLLSKRGLPTTILLVVLVLLLGLTPQTIYAFGNAENAITVIGQTSFTSRFADTTQSNLFENEGVAFDSGGNLWVADQSNSRVLEFTPGTPPCSSGQFCTGMDAALVIGQGSFTSNTIQYPPTLNSLNYPAGVAFDSSGNLWVADKGDSRVLEFTPGTPPCSSGQFCTGMDAALVIGQGTPITRNGLDQPMGVAFDSGGNLWVADSDGCRVLEFSPPFSNEMDAALVIGELGFIGDTCMHTQNYMDGPTSVANDSAGNLWVADQGNSRVLEFSPPFSNGMPAALVIGQPGFKTSTYNQGSGFSSSSCNIGDRSVNPCGLFNPAGVAFDSSGNLWVGDYGNNRVLEFQGGGRTTTTVSCVPSRVAVGGVGSPSTCTATVTGSSPTGTVNWAQGTPGTSTVTFSSTSCTLTSGSCSVTVTGGSGSGSVTVTGSYGGDGNNLGSSGAFFLTLYFPTHWCFWCGSTSSSVVVFGVVVGIWVAIPTFVLILGLGIIIIRRRRSKGRIRH
jgi:sugar lactone lactonase YvrE